VTQAPATPRLTSLAHGGGCGCKIAPGLLRQILGQSAPTAGFADLLVGRETSDDAAVWRLSDTQALVATTDFFMPMVDDPHLFGRIAATNALSDVYAMGARPIFALAIVGMPIDKLPPTVIAEILAGGAETCAQAGVPIVGGHSIDSVEPIYGLVALGLVHPQKILTNRGARRGDQLILTKGLGVGVFSAAFKQGRLPPEAYAALARSATTLNAVGATLGETAGVHALTDVTGFGLLGHALEMAEGACVDIRLDPGAVPLLPGAEALARDGIRTGASTRNWAAYGDKIHGAAGIEDWRRDLLTDPQTSGGLLICVAKGQAQAVLSLVQGQGFADAALIGEVIDGQGRISLCP